MTYQNSPQMLHTYTARLADASLSTHALPSGRPSLPTPPHARKITLSPPPSLTYPRHPAPNGPEHRCYWPPRILPCSIFSPVDFFLHFFWSPETLLDILQKFIISKSLAAAEVMKNLCTKSVDNLYTVCQQKSTQWVVCD